MDNEIWKDVPGYEGLYQVSNLGRVKSLQRLVKHNYGGLKTIPEKIKDTCIDHKGYVNVGLYKEGRGKTLKVHRIVASVFIPNTENKKEVNHKKGNKLDNRASELEWTTSQENVDHRKDVLKSYAKSGDHYLAKKVTQFFINGTVKKVFNSLSDAERETGINHGSISCVISGKRITAGGFKWA